MPQYLIRLERSAWWFAEVKLEAENEADAREKIHEMTVRPDVIEWKESPSMIEVLTLEEQESEEQIAQELWWRSPEGQAQEIIEEAQIEQLLAEMNEEE
jgi:hypothetical protein